MKCLVECCKKSAAGDRKTYRGLCLSCYSSAKKLVEAGVATWEKYEELGMVEKASDPFTDALNKATKVQ